jgi:hypothetical protein
MAITLIVNNTPFDYPEQGEQQPWGEAASGWATEVTAVINSLKGPSDILETSAPLLINQTKAVIPNFFFDPGTVGAFSASGFISIADEVTERFLIEGRRNGTSWDYTIEGIGDSGIKLEVEDTGQVVYTSGVFSTTKSSYVKFKGTALIKK